MGKLSTRILKESRNRTVKDIGIRTRVGLWCKFYDFYDYINIKQTLWSSLFSDHIYYRLIKWLVKKENPEVILGRNGSAEKIFWKLQNKNSYPSKLGMELEYSNIFPYCIAKHTNFKDRTVFINYHMQSMDELFNG